MATMFNVLDPITKRWTGFVGDEVFSGEQLAAICQKLARKYRMSFVEIFRMFRQAMHGPEALADDFDLNRELRLIRQEAEEDLELMTTIDDLPLAELAQIWERARTRALRSANFFPYRREEYMALVARCDEMLAATANKLLRKFEA